MNVPTLVYLVVGALVAAFFGLFCVTAWRERTPRAALLAGLSCALLVAAWLGGHLALGDAPHWLWLPSGAVLFLGLLFFLPLGGTRPIVKTGAVRRVDERDTMFAREDYVPGTAEHERYYAMRPENEKADDRIRRMPPLLAPGGKLYDPVGSGFADSLFDIIHRTVSDVDGPVSEPPADTPSGPSPDLSDPLSTTRAIKRLAMQMGAAEVGVARLDQDFVYSHVGRGPEPWGAPIETDHRYVIVFSLEMDYELVETAPAVPLTTESANQYLKGTMISLALADLIRKLGSPARAQVSGSNYQLILPAVARDAGLGELARHGYLISKKMGARIRLGAVTTDLELVPDEPVAFGVREFCEVCKRCATSCPSGSIPNGAREENNGVLKWTIKTEPCLQYWRYIGSDCGLCMKVCPYAHPRSLVHQVVRHGVSRSAFARWISTHAEDLFYGRITKAPRLSELREGDGASA